MDPLPSPASVDLLLPRDLRFGAGRVAGLADAAVALGVTRALVVTGRTTARADALRRVLADAGVPTDVLPVTGEPSVEDVRRGVARVRETGSDGVVGYGGGSALDTAKAVALLAPSGADPLDHLEVVGRGLPVRRGGLPCLAVPTTAGTGAEATRNAVLEAGGVKASLRSTLMLPAVAVVDPDLLEGLPPATVAASGADALTQLVEPFLSVRATPLTDALARQGLRRSARSLRAAHEHGLDGAGAAARREDLALASLLSGICLTNAGLGVVHGFAGVVGARHAAPHGAVCGALLVPALEVTLRALAERAPDSPARAKADELGPLLTGEAAAGAAEAVRWLAELRRGLDLPALGAHGVTPADVPDLVAGARRASSTRASAVALTDEELAEVVTRAL